MNSPKLFLTLMILISCAISVNAQNAKPKFKKLIYLTYQPNDSIKGMGVTIVNYLEINQNGMLHYISNNYNGENFTGRIRDTTYRIPDTLMVEFSNIFDGSRKLESYLKKDKAKDLTGFAGPFLFFTYTANNESTDELLVGKFSLEPELLHVLHKIYSLRPKWKAEDSGKIYRNKSIEARVIKAYNECNCFPKLQPHPTLKKLKIDGN